MPCVCGFSIPLIFQTQDFPMPAVIVCDMKGVRRAAEPALRTRQNSARLVSFQFPYTDRYSKMCSQYLWLRCYLVPLFPNNHCMSYLWTKIYLINWYVTLSKQVGDGGARASLWFSSNSLPLHRVPGLVPSHRFRTTPTLWLLPRLGYSSQRKGRVTLLAIGVFDYYIHRRPTPSHSSSLLIYNTASGLITSVLWSHRQIHALHNQIFAIVGILNWWWFKGHEIWPSACGLWLPSLSPLSSFTILFIRNTRTRR